MKQAGEGADYMEGCEGMRSQRCFKCGGTGHWAAECKGLEVLTPEKPYEKTPHLTNAVCQQLASYRNTLHALYSEVPSFLSAGLTHLTLHWQADGAEGEVQPRVTARAAAAAAVRPVNIRPAGDMWAPEGGYAVRQPALVLACQAGTQVG